MIVGNDLVPQGARQQLLKTTIASGSLAAFQRIEMLGNAPQNIVCQHGRFFPSWCFLVGFMFAVTQNTKGPVGCILLQVRASLNALYVDWLYFGQKSTTLRTTFSCSRTMFAVSRIKLILLTVLFFSRSTKSTVNQFSANKSKQSYNLGCISWITVQYGQDFTSNTT